MSSLNLRVDLHAERFEFGRLSGDSDVEKQNHVFQALVEVFSFDVVARTCKGS